MLFSFPHVTEMFHFTWFPLHEAPLAKHPPLRRMGCPIRRSPDQRLFATSPRLIAGFDVLHRLFVPRHPPYTLYCSNSFTLSARGGLFNRVNPQKNYRQHQRVYNLLQDLTYTLVKTFFHYSYLFSCQSAGGISQWSVNATGPATNSPETIPTRPRTTTD